MADLGDDGGSGLLKLGELLAVEQRGSLLERPALRLDDEEVQEAELEREPRAVDDLYRIVARSGHVKIKERSKRGRRT